MAGTIRDLFALELDDATERSRSRRLCLGEPEALIELYDDVAPLAYRWALHLTGSKRKSVGVIRDAFARAADEPRVFCDHRVSSRVWFLTEVHHLAWPLRAGRHRTSPHLAAAAPVRR